MPHAGSNSRSKMPCLIARMYSTQPGPYGVLEITYSLRLLDVADDDRFPNASGKTILDDLNDQLMLGSQIQVLW